MSTKERASRGSADEGQKANPSRPPRIPNPIVCLSAGDMLIFALTVNHSGTVPFFFIRHHFTRAKLFSVVFCSPSDRRLSHFPIYQKDHLFNSNPSWDFGAFRRLQMLTKQSNFNSTRYRYRYRRPNTGSLLFCDPTTEVFFLFFLFCFFYRFAHIFTDTGKYVFADSAVPERSIVVVVSEEGTECDPRSSVFEPMMPALLVKHGIVKQHRLNLLPDWGLISGVCPCCILILLLHSNKFLFL